MLSISGNPKVFVELIGDLAPLLGTILANKPDQLLVFPFDPIALLNRRLFILVEFILALRIIPAWNKASDFNPVVLVQFLWADVLASTILLDGPLQELSLVVCPIFLGVISLLALKLGQLIKDF